ncbi:probable LRR receptor-like serine/threonine-protein kinase At4g37250 [Helianthus annuus]|uniref:probable LRR receptor-like serine/threonine-protein kinase At4g37250 n=1 Tax=Helianthus annuus TaxID=4232 RepID=UPI000B8F9F2D|nr:probable LRR receptor-like serine/threonine-protein kinase At4g37250 [Helianthus annuus]
MNTYTFSISISIFCILTHISSSLTSDGLSLLALKSAITTDPTNSLTTWSETDSTPCHWSGITCNSAHRVTAVFFPHRNLTGYLPSELGALLSLKHLTLSNNNFSKPIPDHLFNATNLLPIDLSHNSLTGPLPEKIKNLKMLMFFETLLASPELLTCRGMNFPARFRRLTGCFRSWLVWISGVAGTTAAVDDGTGSAGGLIADVTLITASPDVTASFSLTTRSDSIYDCRLLWTESLRESRRNMLLFVHVSGADDRYGDRG